MSLIEIKNLSKYYGKDNTLVKAIDDVSFNVDSKELVAIVGASGSGKTTLLNLMGTIDYATSGDILINGVNITKNRFEDLTIFRRKNIGYIFQDYNLIETLTVKKNIFLPVLLDNQKVDRDYFEKLVKVTGIEKILNKYPYEISGGEVQRVAIVRALISKPLIVLADEPTGNLDKENTLEIIKLLKECNENLGCTIIVVTHDDVVANEANRIITITDGKIESDTKNA
jgi:putative ABC transport system ATP-binding protein